MPCNSMDMEKKFKSVKHSFMLVLLVLMELTFAGRALASLSCENLFPGGPYRMADAFIEKYRINKKTKTLIEEGNSYHADGTISRAVAFKLLHEVTSQLTHTVVLHEVDTEEFKRFRKKLSTDIKQLNVEIQKKERFDFFTLLEISLRASHIFDASEASATAATKVRMGPGPLDPEDVLAQRAEYIETLDHTRYDKNSNDVQIKKLRESLLSNPTAKLILSFQPVSEIEIYQLLRNRIFIIGLSPVAALIDGNVMPPTEFLNHDIVHYNGFFGYDTKSALFNGPNQTLEGMSISAVDTAWTRLEKQFYQLEDVLVRLDRDGRFKDNEIVGHFFFQAYHEAFESIYKRLSRSKNRQLSIEESILDEYRNFGGETPRSLKVAADLSIIMQEARRVLVP